MKVNEIGRRSPLRMLEPPFQMGDLEFSDMSRFRYKLKMDDKKNERKYKHKINTHVRL